MNSNCKVELTETACVTLFVWDVACSANIMLGSWGGTVHSYAPHTCTEIVSALLSRCGMAEVNALNASQNTPLHWAALNGQLAVVKMLVEAGGELDVRSPAVPSFSLSFTMF